MTLEQLRVFVAVAETLNMRMAGERLHLTQPAVSAAVLALEARHNTILFNRVGRRLELSAAGIEFLPEAKAVLARAIEAQRVLEDLAGLVRGEVRIVASQTVSTYWLPGRVARFAEQHPGIQVSLVAGNTASAVAAVLSGNADLGFIEGDAQEAALRFERVGGDRLGVYAAPGHALEGRVIGKPELLAAVWASREVGSGTRKQFEEALTTMGVELRDLSVRLVLPSNGALLEAVGNGGLVGAVSDLAAASRLALNKVVRLNCTLPMRDFSMVSHKERHLSRAAATFVNALLA
ncbi:LysR substrate-binding domain-containing protein [Roseateles chitinivorans]|uniref:LysR substrate-binding domain-containing protein n=1 Tax=Roseateles chitinivorans TaxID=2917965 RepID=UPI003D666985